MQHGRKRNMNRQQNRHFAGRSQRPPPSTPRLEPQGSHNARRSYDRYMALAEAELQAGDRSRPRTTTSTPNIISECPRIEERHNGQLVTASTLLLRPTRSDHSPSGSLDQT